MFNMLGAFAEFERDIRAERQADGIEKAKEKGVKFGRNAKLTDQQIAEMKQKALTGEVSRAELAKEYGISRATLYRLIS